MHTTDGCRSVKMYKSHVFLSFTSEQSKWQIYCIYRTCVRACVCLSVCSELVNQTRPNFCPKMSNLKLKTTKFRVKIKTLSTRNFLSKICGCLSENLHDRANIELARSGQLVEPAWSCKRGITVPSTFSTTHVAARNSFSILGRDCVGRFRTVPIIGSSPLQKSLPRATIYRQKSAPPGSRPCGADFYR